MVESDKADMDVESFAEGTLAAIATPEGERANVGAAIAFIAESDSDVSNPAQFHGQNDTVPTLIRSAQWLWPRSSCSHPAQGSSAGPEYSKVV